MVFPNLVEVGDINTHWYSRISEGKYLQAGKVRPVEFLLLKIFAPWQPGYDLLRITNKIEEYLRLDLIDDGYEPLVLSPHPQRIQIRLNKPYVSFDEGSLILYPEYLRLLKLVHVTSLEMLDIGFKHVLLGVVSGVVDSFSQILSDRFQK